MADREVVIYTIGHGRHAFRDFLALLEKHDIRFVCDVRTAARSRWPQFNGRVLEELLNEHGIGYEHLPECGGKVIASLEERTRGIERILELASETNVALMCSESYPLTGHKEPRANCHRVSLLSIPLRERGGVHIKHIMPDGTLLEFDETKVASIW